VRVRLQRVIAKVEISSSSWREFEMAKIKIEIDTESFEHDGKGTHGVRPFAKDRIGVVSSIGMLPVLKDAFTRGVNDGSIRTKFKDKVGYKKNANQKLRDEIDKFNTTADLIVTVGGSVAYEAAKEVATIDFLSLVGTIDEDPPECFWGGVSLESYASNRDRIAILEGKDKIEGGAKITRAEIGLFCNPNSAMHDAEVGHWKFEIGTETQVFTGGNDANGDNNAAAYATDFLPAKIPPEINALVISADPFFQETKQQLIDAANAWIDAAAEGANRYVCYPSLAYADVVTKAKKAILYGPNLVTAYELLGQLAAFAIKGRPKQPVLRLGNTLQDLSK